MAINTSDRPIVLNRSGLHSEIARAVQRVLEHQRARYGDAPQRPTWKKRHFAFQYFFRHGSRGVKVKQSRNCLEAIFDVVSAKDVGQPASDALNELRKYFYGPAVQAAAMANLRHGCRAILYCLWDQGAVLLPTVLRMESFFDAPVTDCELLAIFRKLDSDCANGKSLVTSGYAGRIYGNTRRILLATSWRSVEDVSILEYGDLHRAVLRFVDGAHPSRMISAPVPWTALLAELQRRFPRRVSYSAEELRIYSEWMLSRYYTTHSYKQYLSRREEILGARAESQNELRTKRSKVGRVSGWSAKEREANAASRNFAEDGRHDSAVQYFVLFKARERNGFDWIGESSPYVGREHIDIGSMGRIWKGTFIEYLKYRKFIKGFEMEKEVKRSLNCLADYILLYLPWWKELHPKAAVEVPISPAKFTRYAFVYRSEPVDVEQMPLTFLDMLDKRGLAPDSKYPVLKHIQKYFSFVESQYSDDATVAGTSFKNPIRGEFDMPRLKKRGKTKKEVFPIGAYGQLIHYGYAVEAFGEFLLRAAVEDELGLGIRARRYTRAFDASQLGCVPIILYRGKVHSLRSVPNVFLWAYRWVRDSRGNRVRRYIPHLTGLRLLLSAAETGLRLQSWQWLDRNTWDSLNSGVTHSKRFSYLPAGNYVYDVIVNTDKVRSEPWVTSVVFRVRDLFYREIDFQTNVLHPRDDSQVSYEGRDVTRFDPIVPVFRGSGSANPIGDALYAEEWVKFLSGFENYFNGIVDTEPVQFVRIGPTIGRSKKPTIVNNNGRLYCPLSYRAINTPHACRATFATNRQGHLEASEIAQLIGHLGEMETVYYQKAHPKDLADKLARSDIVMRGEFDLFDRAKAPYIRADRSESALVVNFTRNRSETIKSHGFIPPITLGSAEMEEKTEDGLRLLQESPLSLIKFRPTHICTVGENCPPEIVRKIGAPRRCGLCPLAMKCVDHLTAIAAEKNALIEKIRYQHGLIQRMQAANEPAIAVDEVWEAMELDTNELIGWHVSEELLLREYEKLKKEMSTAGGVTTYHVAMPDMVRRHLERVAKKTSDAEFLLHRLAQTNIYKNLESPQLVAAATQIRKRLLASPDNASDLLGFKEVDEVAVVAKLLGTICEARGMTIRDVALLLCDEGDGAWGRLIAEG